MFGREVLDLEEVDLALEFRDLGFELIEALLKRLVLASKSFGGDLVLHVEVVDLLHLPFERPALVLKDGEELGLLGDRAVSLVEVGGDVVFGEEKISELFLVDGFEVAGRDLVPALPAGVLGRVRRYVHRLAAPAVRDAGEDVVRRLPGDLLRLRLLPGQDRIALLPELLGDDRLDVTKYPLRLRF